MSKSKDKSEPLCSSGDVIDIVKSRSNLPTVFPGTWVVWTRPIFGARAGALIIPDDPSRNPLGYSIDVEKKQIERISPRLFVMHTSAKDILEAIERCPLLNDSDHKNIKQPIQSQENNLKKLFQKSFQKAAADKSEKSGESVDNSQNITEEIDLDDLM